MVELLLRRDLKIWQERIERTISISMKELYLNLQHYDDKSIVDQEKWNSMTGSREEDT